MTRDTERRIDETGESTRRTFLKAGGATVVGASLAAGGFGSVTAQDGDDGLFVEDEAFEGLMYPAHFEPGGLFIVTSPSIDNRPGEIEGLFQGLFSDFNMRVIRYIRPDTQNVPLFPREAADVGTYRNQLGYVVDDDFVENGNVVLDGTRLRDLDPDQFDNVRPAIFALGQNTESFEDSENLVSVAFSPIPQNEEERIFNEYRNQIFGAEEPFGPAPQETTPGDQTTTVGNQTTEAGN